MSPYRIAAPSPPRPRPEQPRFVVRATVQLLAVARVLALVALVIVFPVFWVPVVIAGIGALKALAAEMFEARSRRLVEISKRAP